MFFVFTILKDRAKKTWRDFVSTCLVPRCYRHLGPGQAEARNLGKLHLGLPRGWEGPKQLRTSAAAPPALGEQEAGIESRGLQFRLALCYRMWA